jgi:protein-tyrosine-phosphatase
MCRKCRKKSNGWRFFQKVCSSGFKAISTGTKPVSQINPLAVQAMREAGIDISNQKSKEITDRIIINSTKVVNIVVWIKIHVILFLLIVLLIRK